MMCAIGKAQYETDESKLNGRKLRKIRNSTCTHRHGNEISKLMNQTMKNYAGNTNQWQELVRKGKYLMCARESSKASRKSEILTNSARQQASN
jgi:hypothetical protein